MDETFVRLACPNCTKTWEATPTELPTCTTDFSCPDCDTARSLAEFTRTKKDLEVLQAFT